jgi:FkbM family methyltransferase
MINRFSKDHPWLYRKIKNQYWFILSKYLRKDSYIHHIVDLDIRIKLLTKDDSVSQNIFLESYEKETISFLKRIVLPGDIIYDIGANIGYYTLIFSKLAGPTGWIHSFEPSKREFFLLAENIKLNFLNNVYINQFAVSDFPGIIEMSVFDDPAYGAYNTIGLPTHQRVENQIFRKEAVRSITLDEYYAAYSVQKPSILKIDVEGAEMNVLKGGKKLLSCDDSPILVIEICEDTLKGMEIIPDQVLELLRIYSYILFSIRSDGFLVPFDEKISLNLIAVKKHTLQRFEKEGLTIE